MAVGQFTKAKEGVILGGDFSNAVFGTVAISFNDYICAVDIGSEILILDNGDVEYYAILSKKGMTRKTANLINATTHAVISTLIPGASLAGAIAGHTAAAAAGVATGNAAAHAAGGIRDYRDVIVVFRDQKKCIIRCSDLYFKKIKKYCEERKLSEYEIDELLNSKSKHLDTKASPSEHAKKKNDPKYKYANDSVSSSREDYSSGRQNYLGETHECPRCYNKISKGDKYCSSCGSKIEPVLSNCYNCGHKLKGKDRYCPYCGHPVMGTASKRINNASAEFYIPSRKREVSSDLLSVAKDASTSSSARNNKLKRKKLFSRIAFFGLRILPPIIVCIALVYILNPPETVIRWRFERVLDACEKKEESQKCKNIQSIYKITYEYCHAFFDIPEIDKSIPVYGVATRNDFKGDALMSLRPYSDNSNAKIRPYYGCVANYADLDSKGSNLHDATKESQATYWLEDRPSISFSLDKCTISRHAFSSVLWRNIPNWGEIAMEETNAFLRYDGACVKGMEYELKKTDDKLAKYSENKTVQAYYAGFDVWNESLHLGESCIYDKGTATEKTFRGKCLTSVGEEGYPMRGFVDFMEDRRSSIYYDSKPISQ